MVYPRQYSALTWWLKVYIDGNQTGYCISYGQKLQSQQLNYNSSSKVEEFQSWEMDHHLAAKSCLSITKVPGSIFTIFCLKTNLDQDPGASLPVRGVNTGLNRPMSQQICPEKLVCFLLWINEQSKFSAKPSNVVLDCLLPLLFFLSSFHH